MLEKRWSLQRARVLEGGTRPIHLVEEGEPRAAGGELLERVEIVAGERIGRGQRIRGGEIDISSTFHCVMVGLSFSGYKPFQKKK